MEWIRKWVVRGRFSTQVFWAATTVLLFGAGCLELEINVDLQRDGSGMLTLNYLVFEDVLSGKYVEFEQNNLLPFSEEQAETWVKQFAGVKLLDVETRSITDDPRLEKVGGLRHFRIRLAFDDIEAFQTSHVRFAFYPYGEYRWFQMNIEKSVTKEQIEAGESVNPIAEGMLVNRFLRLSVNFPSKVIVANADDSDWATAQWEIPMPLIVASPQPRIVAWAKLPLESDLTWKGWVNPFLFWIQGESWRDPDTLPGGLVPTPLSTPAGQ